MLSISEYYVWKWVWEVGVGWVERASGQEGEIYVDDVYQYTAHW